MIQQETTQAIDNWLAANGGPRRVEPGASGNPEHVVAYLRGHGWNCSFRGHGRLTRAILIKGGRTKRLTFKQFWLFVNDLRLSDGLEPFAPRQGRAA